jgi:hypothetical protein
MQVLGQVEERESTTIPVMVIIPRSVIVVAVVIERKRF